MHARKKQVTCNCNSAMQSVSLYGTTWYGSPWQPHVHTLVLVYFPTLIDGGSGRLQPLLVPLMAGLRVPANAMAVAITGGDGRGQGRRAPMASWVVLDRPAC